MARLGQYAKNISALVGQSVIQRALGMVTSMVLARVLGAASFGIYGIVRTTSASAYGLVRFGVDSGVHVMTAESTDDPATRQRTGRVLGTGLILLVGAGLAAGLICVFAASEIATRIFGKSDLTIWIRMAGVLVFLECAAQYCYVALAGLHRFTAYARIMVYAAVINVAAIVAGAYVAGLAGAVGGMLAAQLVNVLLLVRGVRRGVRDASLSLSIKGFVAHARTLLRFGLPFYLSGFIAIPVTYLMQGLLVKHHGLGAMGYYRVIVAISGMVSFVPSSIAGAMISMLTKTRVDAPGVLHVRMFQNVRMVYVFTLISAFVLMLVLPWMIDLLYGQQYAPAVRPGALMLLLTVLTCTTTATGNVLFSVKRVDLILVATVAQVLAFGVAGELLIARYGLVGYVASDIAGFGCFLACITMISMKRLATDAIGASWILRSLVPLLALAAYAGGFVIGLPITWLAAYGILGTAFACIWSAFLLLEPDERGRLLALSKAWAGKRAR